MNGRVGFFLHVDDFAAHYDRMIAAGCELRAVRAEAYPPRPGEAQYLWYKTLP